MLLFDQIMQEYSRKKEDRINDEIASANPKNSNPISSLIDKTLKDNHHVWLMTDWHFLKWNKETKTAYQSPTYVEIITNSQRIMKPDDLLIFLGDLCDGEVEKKDAISAFISKIPCTKILVRGNNDLFSDTWYTQHGFKYVTPKFIWDNILFSHRPSDNNNRMNIHGHIHNSKTYYNSEISQFTNQIDVAYLGGRTKPVDLYEVIGKQPEYASVVKFFDHPYVSKKKR